MYLFLTVRFFSETPWFPTKMRATAPTIGISHFRPYFRATITDPGFKGSRTIATSD